MTDEALAEEYDQVLLGETFVEPTPSPATTAPVRPAPAASCTSPSSARRGRQSHRRCRSARRRPAGDAAEAEAQAGLRRALRDRGSSMSAPLPSSSAPSPRATAPVPRRVGTSAGSRARALISEFTGPIWETSIRSQATSWARSHLRLACHQFQGFRSSLDVRVVEVEQVLAAEAVDFDAVGAETLDDPADADGEVSVWKVFHQLPRASCSS